ncbi:ABC transporter ATP-binding protein [Loigolactobacillus bifermentans]|nr:ABC transporter ATP-binding protein [Loigolactobacillus bifermentans]QGG61129.1 ATP-binding cassette domain-containing protein [Loigolactobacillus bifermentans]
MFQIIWQHTRRWQRVCLFAAPLVMLMEVFCDLQQPTLMSKIVDTGLAGSGHPQFILQTGGVMLLIALVGACSGSGCNALASYASLKMGQRLRNHLLSLALATRNGHDLSTPTLITRITNDVIQMQNLVMTLTRSLVRAPFLLLGGIVMAFLISPRIAWILAIVVPVLLLFMGLVIRHSVPLFTKMQQAIDRINRVMRETLLGIKTVKSFTLENQQQQLFDQINQQVQTSSVAAQASVIILAPVVTLALNLSIVAALWFGGGLHASHLITTGQIMAFVNYMIQITTAMINTVNTVSSLSRAQTATARIQAVLDLPQDAEPTATVALPTDTTLRFEHVNFAYPGGENVLTDIDFELPAGAKLGIIGTTGSGKTTLVDLLTRLYDPTSGRITIGGVPINQLSLAQLRQQVAVALQNSVLFSGTIASNLRYGKETATDAELVVAAQAAAAADFIAARPGGYQAQVTQRGNNFSGGQKQRLNIARALVAQAAILVLDDTTSAVDLATDAHIQQALRQVRQGKTTIMIAQRIAALQDSDLILVLDHGHIVARGQHATLLQESAFYREVAVAQLGKEVLTDA